MGHKTPTSRKSKRKQERINLIPILDAVFIFIFFLLMSTQFVKVFEIGSDVPILSSSPPPKNQKKPLALTLTIQRSGFAVSQGVPSRIVKRISKLNNGQYDLNRLHEYLITVKRKYLNEESIILEPIVDLKYEEIIQIMDSVRMLKNTDDSFYRKDKDGIDVRIKTLFSKIIFGNLMS